MDIYSHLFIKCELSTHCKKHSQVHIDPLWDIENIEFGIQNIEIYKYRILEYGILEYGISEYGY